MDSIRVTGKTLTASGPRTIAGGATVTEALEGAR